MIPLWVEFLADLFSSPFLRYHDSPLVEDLKWLTLLLTHNKDEL